MEKLTTLQLVMRFKDPQTGGIIDLRNLDLTSVNMQDEKVKSEFQKIAELIDKNREDPPLYIDMTGSDISGADMRGYDLSNAIMTGVRAYKTVFINTVMSDTHLDKALLIQADFRQADLYHSKFYESNIKGANFSGARMTHTHGLGLKQLDQVVERLAVASTIRDAFLPDEIEKYREQIQEKIRQYRDEIPQYAADLIEYDEQHSQAGQQTEKIVEPVVGSGFFGSDWLKKKSEETD